jgi:selenocysteine-specific elongation factor
MKELIIGTAGHVDHGKTALIEALTGYNGDELPQERERGITIDLSFSNMSREGVNVAFIDVPGHEKLIKTMVSGAFGFDAAMLLVAADEGMMPQSYEHLEVLSLLGVRRIVGVLSRADLADEETLRRRRRELEEWFAAREDLELTALFETSIHDRSSIDRLREYLFALPPRDRKEGEFFRYYIDRIFSPRGAGTVVTGTVLSGEVRRGEKLNVAELGKPATVRAIQIHGRERESAHTHQRAALNLDINHRKLQKGFLLCTRGYFRGFDRIDVSLCILEGMELKQDMELLFLSGAKRVEARISLHEGEEFATLRLRERVFTRFGDPYVLLAAGRPAGGGEILIPISEPIRRRQKRALLEALKDRRRPEAFGILLANHRRGFGLISSQQRFAMSQEEALKIAEGLEEAFVDREGKVVYPKETLRDLARSIREIYEANPRALLSPASVSLRISWASEALVKEAMRLLEEEGTIRREQGLYLRADQDPGELIDTLQERIYTILDEEGMTPEAPYNLYDRLDLDRKRGDEVLKALTRRKKVIRLAHNLFVTENNLRRALATMREIMTAQGYIDIRNFKAATGMSRKYCIAYLEYLDQSGEVRREGERRLPRYDM